MDLQNAESRQTEMPSHLSSTSDRDHIVLSWNEFGDHRKLSSLPDRESSSLEFEPQPRTRTTKQTISSLAITDPNEIVGRILGNRRRLRTVYRRLNPVEYPKVRMAAKGPLRLSRESRLRKWHAFENSNIDDYVTSAALMGYESCLVTLKLPSVNWLNFAPTPASFHAQHKALLRQLGSRRRYAVPNFNKEAYTLSALEFKVTGHNAPHFHDVMMLPTGADDTVRRLWRERLGLPNWLPDDEVVHVSRKYSDPENPVESFRRASRYLCGDKGRQEIVAPLWADQSLNVGSMWSVRGFTPYPDAEYEIRAQDSDRTKALLESFSSRPLFAVDQVTGERMRNSMPRHQQESPNGNTEVLGTSTAEVMDRIIKLNGWM
ncbi:hypothetical protein SAMN04489740_0215 [Arthrobacter alpinus]|uniref:Replication protein n=1 Tax=Arthrobacter alpinus TaxID=656366 RepID=A0A1H5ED67_9MICC|nr:hypothetical protein [Arthrobacter alpinus]SED89052.1 hypothetical protein SAMN04489740_0215 [Arthrobacter alpinus]